MAARRTTPAVRRPGCDDRILDRARTSAAALDFNANRTLGPLLVLAMLTLGTPTPVRSGLPDEGGCPDGDARVGELEPAAG